MQAAPPDAGKIRQAPSRERCRIRLWLWASALLLLLCVPAVSLAQTARKTENVLVVTLDGFRWQELFGGADESYMDGKQGGAKGIQTFKARYLRETAAERREALMPFLWRTIARQGQVFGNPARQAAARVTNGMYFSYPGYSEIFCGVGDPRVNSNSKVDNPNLSVLEFLNRQPAFENRVEVAATWDVFPFIFRSRQTRLRVHCGWEPIDEETLTDGERVLNETMEQLPRYWPGSTFDAISMGAARSALQRRKPRVLFLGLGETDEWGHGRRYDLYLDAANKADRFLEETWNWLQHDAQYAGKTTLLITTDHGRGSNHENWINHGKDVPEAELIWIAVMGPDTPALGERADVEVTQSQVAATIAAFVGEDFRSASPNAAPPLPVFAAK